MEAAMSKSWRIIPLILLALVVAGLVWRLATPADTSVTSKLEGQPVPSFALAPAIAGKQGLATADLAGGGPRLVNIFASWCVPCITEAGVLAQLKARGATVDGIAIRDRPEDVARFLARHGDPYDRIGSDPRSQVQIALGSSGVPESFIVDDRGIIRYQHIGPIDAKEIPLILGELEQSR